MYKDVYYNVDLKFECINMSCFKLHTRRLARIKQAYHYVKVINQLIATKKSQADTMPDVYIEFKI